LVFDISNQSSSNLINNPEIIEKFNSEARKILYSLYHKYYQVFEVMEVDDVIGECWKKILSKNISYDPSKGTSFRTFTYMIVTSKLIDITRIINHTPIPNIVGIDNDDMDILDTVPCTKSTYEFKKLEILSEAEEFVELFNGFPKLEEIFNLYIMGFNTQEVSDITGVRYDLIRKTISMMGDIHRHRENNSAKYFGDILYYESTTWEKSPEDRQRRNYIMYFSSLILDIKTNICLKRVVDGVLKDLSYRNISDKLNVEVCDVKRILHKYEGVLV